MVNIDNKGDGDFVLTPTTSAVIALVGFVIFGIAVFLLSGLFWWPLAQTQTQQEQILDELKEVREDAKTAKEFQIKNAERQAQANTNVNSEEK